MLRRQANEPWLAIFCYLLVALYLTAPIHGELATRFLGGDSGDVYEMARHVWWYKTALQTGEDIFEHSLLGFPEGFPAVQLWANPLQFFPMWLFAFVMPLAAAYNIGVLLTLVLNGLSMYVLARRKLPGSSQFPAFVAGLVYMTLPTLQGHLFDGHAGLLVQWPVPLFVLFLFNYADHGGSRRYVSCVLFFLLAVMGHTLQVVYVLAPLSVMFLLARLHRRDHLGAARLVAVVLLGSFLLLLFLSPILAETLNNLQFSETGGYVRYSIDLLGVVSPSFANPFWSNIATHSPHVIGTNLGEGASYIGLLGGFLALIGIIRWRETRWWAAVALVAWVLALGPVLKVYDQAVSASIAGYEAVVPLPYALFINLPLFELARTPGRFMFLFAAMFALLVGFGMTALCSSRLIQRRSRYVQLAAAVILTVLVIEDYKLFAVFPSVSAEISQEIRNLKRRRDIRAIYNVPYDNLLAAKEAMYLQTAHGKPLIAGHDTRVTTVDRARLALLAKFRPSLLADAGADIVIINKVRAVESGQMDLLQWRARLELGEPIFEDQRFVIYDTPLSRDRAPAVYSPVAEEQSHVTYIYKEQPGWLEFNATLEAANRRVHLSLNDTPLESLVVNGRIPLSIPLPIARRGYHTFRIALDPPCPERIDTSLLLCQNVTVENVKIVPLSDGAIYDPIRIEDGIVLAGYLLPERSGEELSVRLWWRFESDRSANDVRFVHVLDVNGRPVPAGPPDLSFGEVSAGSEITETVTLGTSQLSKGEFRVLTGWYELPQAIRYDVLTNVEGAQDDTVVLGTIRIDE